MKVPGWIADENNLAKQASVTGTNPTDTTNFPERNLITLPVSKTLRIDNRASNKLHLTFNRAVSIDFAALIGHNLSSGATITLRAGTNWDQATFAQAITWRRRTAFLWLTGFQSYQYWSIEIDDDANEHPYLEFGYCVLGALTEGPYGPQDGWSYFDDMIQVRTESPTGAPDIRALTERQHVEMRFEALTTGEASTIRNLFLDLAGREKPLFFIPDTLVNDGFFGRFEQDGFALEHTNDVRRAVNLTLLEDPTGFSLEATLPSLRSGESLPSGSVFTRASTAWHKNRSLELISAAVDTIRDPHYLDDGKFGIILEPQRRNEWTFSEDLSNAAYTKTRASITTDDADEPKATPATAADKLVEDSTASATHTIERTLSGTDNTNQSLSFLVKAAERSFIRVDTISKANNTLSTRVNLTTGAISSQGHSVFFVESYANSWWRVMLVFDVESGGTTPLLRVLMGSADGVYSYNGDGTSGIHLWQWQHEQDVNWPSSIIPTTGSTATRNADTLQLALAFGPRPFTGYFSYWEIGQNQIGPLDGYLIRMGHRTDTFTDPRLLIRSSGSGLEQVADDGTNFLTATLTYSANPTDGVEIRCVAHVDGSVTIGESVNGSSEDTATDSSPLFSYEDAGAWLEAFMAICYKPGDAEGGPLILLREMKFAENEQTLAFMRLL